MRSVANCRSGHLTIHPCLQSALQGPHPQHGPSLQRPSVVAESPAADNGPDEPQMLFPKWLDPGIAAAAVASLRKMSEVRQGECQLNS